MNIIIKSPDGLAKTTKVFLENGEDISHLISGIKLEANGSDKPAFRAEIVIPRIKVEEIKAAISKISSDIETVYPIWRDMPGANGYYWVNYNSPEGENKTRCVWVDESFCLAMGCEVLGWAGPLTAPKPPQ